MARTGPQRLVLLNQDIDTSFLTLEMLWRGMRDPRVKEHAGMALPPFVLEARGRTIRDGAVVEVDAEKGIVRLVR